MSWVTGIVQNRRCMVRSVALTLLVEDVSDVRHVSCRKLTLTPTLQIKTDVSVSVFVAMSVSVLHRWFDSFKLIVSSSPN